MTERVAKKMTRQRESEDSVTFDSDREGFHLNEDYDMEDFEDSDEDEVIINPPNEILNPEDDDTQNNSFDQDASIRQATVLGWVGNRTSETSKYQYSGKAGSFVQYLHKKQSDLVRNEFISSWEIARQANANLKLSKLQLRTC